MAADIAIQAGLGRFFAARFRSGVLYRIYQKTDDRAALEASLDQYRKARNAWAAFANLAKGVYMSDVTVGELPQLHGHWLDRLPAINRDINQIGWLEPQNEPSPAATLAIKQVLARPERRVVPCRHTAAAKFVPGDALKIDLFLETADASVTLYCRHINQAERFKETKMSRDENQYRAVIPASYTDSPYPLQYYFEVKTKETAFLHPGFSRDLTNQPYFVVRP
jgi:hypothetical protein